MNAWQVPFLYGVTLLLLGLTLSDCGKPTNPGADTSPPEFLNVDIKLENRDGQPSPDTGSTSILANDVTRQISRLKNIRIIATAGDSQSLITKLELATAQGDDGRGVLQHWNLRCAKPGTRNLDLVAMTTTPAIAVPSPQAIAALNVTVDPVGQVGCTTKSLVEDVHL